MWKTLERWWNDKWGLGRRVIRLRTNGEVWRVEAGEGNGDHTYWIHDFATEAEARELIGAMRERTSKRRGDVWRDMGGGD